MQLCTDIYLPSYPFIQQSLHTSISQVQLTLPIFLIGYASSQLFLGTISDRYGRRPVMIFGMTLFVLGSIGCVFAPNISILLISRLLQGLGGGASGAIGRACLRDRYSGRDFGRIIAWIAFGWAIIPLVAPVIGSYIQHLLGWRYNFVFLLLLSVLCWCTAVFALPETLQHPVQSIRLRPLAKMFVTLFSTPVFTLNALCMSGTQAIENAFSVTAPFLLQKGYHLSVITYGWIIFIVTASFLTGSVINNYLLRFFSSHRLAKVGVAINFTPLLILAIWAFIGHVPLVALIVLIFIMQMGSPLLFTNCSTMVMHPFPNLAGSASAIMGSCTFFGGAIASLVMTRFHALHVLPVAIVMLAISAAMFIALYCIDASTVKT